MWTNAECWADSGCCLLFFVSDSVCSKFGFLFENFSTLFSTKPFTSVLVDLGPKNETNMGKNRKHKNWSTFLHGTVFPWEAYFRFCTTFQHWSWNKIRSPAAQVLEQSPSAINRKSSDTVHSCRHFLLHIIRGLNLPSNLPKLPLGPSILFNARPQAVSLHALFHNFY